MWFVIEKKLLKFIIWLEEDKYELTSYDWHRKMLVFFFLFVGDLPLFSEVLFIIW